MMSTFSSFNNQNQSEENNLLIQLKSLVEQCRSRFLNRYELATENDPLVVNLCYSLEQIFSHGLRKSPTTSNRSKLLSGILPKNTNELKFWNFVSLFLTEHEVKRFSSLRNVHTDLGRGRSWIRNSLNEHSLQKYFLMILEDKSEHRQHFYHDWALLLDDQKNIELPSLGQSLNTVLFALNIDIADLDVAALHDQSDSYNDDESAKLAPIKKNETNVLVKSVKKKSNLIVIENANEADFNLYAKSAPSTSIFPTLVNQELADPNLSDEKRSSSSFSINETSNLCLYPIADEINSTSQSPKNDLLNEKVEELKKANDKLVRENNLLNIQLKKYIATIELMKFNQSNAIKTDNVRKSSGDDGEIANYQKKLIQVSEMHGEIVEFNEHLYKVIQIKDSIISRLRNELIELRGPLPDNDESISISTDLESNTHSLQALPQPLIHVWIPTAFLSGGFKGKSHHIYQIYIRIKEEEWNVYRRYSQFHSLYKLLKTQYPCTGRFEFPPKKAIGNKDSRVVQDRRKKLEAYLRNVINHIQMKNTDINNKEKFISTMPFLSDKYFLQDRSQSESNLSGNTQQQQQQSSSRNYMGF